MASKKKTPKRGSDERKKPAARKATSAAQARRTSKPAGKRDDAALAAVKRAPATEKVTAATQPRDTSKPAGKRAAVNRPPATEKVTAAAQPRDTSKPAGKRDAVNRPPATGVQAPATLKQPAAPKQVSRNEHAFRNDRLEVTKPSARAHAASATGRALGNDPFARGAAPRELKTAPPPQAPLPRPPTMELQEKPRASAPRDPRATVPSPHRRPRKPYASSPTLIAFPSQRDFEPREHDAAPGPHASSPTLLVDPQAHHAAPSAVAEPSPHASSPTLLVDPQAHHSAPFAVAEPSPHASSPTMLVDPQAHHAAPVAVEAFSSSPTIIGFSPHAHDTAPSAVGEPQPHSSSPTLIDFPHSHPAVTPPRAQAPQGFGQALKSLADVVRTGAGLASRATQVDHWGKDASLAASLRPLGDFLFDRYWRVRVEGADLVPAGPCIIVANHAGALPLDGPVLHHALRRHRPELPGARWLLEDQLFYAPFIGVLANRAGAVRANPENAHRLLDEGRPIIVFPEGFAGLSKPFAERYQLRRFGRGGYVKIAARRRVPLIPAAIVGGEEAMPLLAKLPGKFLGVDYLPVTPPPLPARWHLRFAPPLTLADAPDEPDTNLAWVERTNLQVRDTIEAMLTDMLRHRESVF